MRIHACPRLLPRLPHLPRPVRLFTLSPSHPLPIPRRSNSRLATDSTNQTTFEHITPFHLLRHLPPLSPSRLSSPPMEHQLAFTQRHAVRVVHARMRLYDVGWRRNALQVFGVSPKRAWATMLLWGGSWYAPSPPPLSLSSPSIAFGG